MIESIPFSNNDGDRTPVGHFETQREHPVHEFLKFRIEIEPGGTARIFFEAFDEAKIRGVNNPAVMTSADLINVFLPSEFDSSPAVLIFLMRGSCKSYFNASLEHVSMQLRHKTHSDFI